MAASEPPKNLTPAWASEQASPWTPSYGALLQSLARSFPRLVPTLLVVALLACILVPLPKLVVDLLLSFSLAASVLLLAAGLLVRQSSEFLSFPALLLLATLYRLALNIQTTRLILTQGNAGRVIDAFADLVVRGEVIVGIVMFGIITTIQYLVVARGSERVAEVAARFALDGLPGHQSAIDADLRSGAYSPQEASRKRSRLVERSNFYGAMDGAMRFVKGDAIAGLAITAINLFGGFAMGIWKRGLSFEESMDVYGRLAIGDGLLAQLPALLTSLAAGILVARVDREQQSSDARTLEWLRPGMLVAPVALLITLSLVPGMPALAFGTMAGGLICAGLWLAFRDNIYLTRKSPARAYQANVQIFVFLHGGRLTDNDRLEEALEELSRRCTLALGIEIPEIVVREDGSLAKNTVKVYLGRRLLSDTEDVALANDDHVVVEVFRALMLHADIFVDIQDIDRMIESTRVRRPVLVREALGILGIKDILALVQGFLRERIPVPPMESLLSAIIQEPLFRHEGERSRWLELARTQLAGFWVRELISAHQRFHKIHWLRPTPDTEEELLGQSQVNGSTIAHEQWMHIVRKAGEQAELQHGARPSLMLLTTPRARYAFALLVQGSSPYIPVLSTAELKAAGLAIPAISSDQWIDSPT